MKLARGNMAVVLRLNKEIGTIRPGDAVFNYRRGARFPLHVGVYVGRKKRVKTSQHGLIVCGLPYCPVSSELGEAAWESRGNYSADIIGQRLDVDEASVKQIALLSKAFVSRLSQLGQRCTWGRSPIIHETETVLDGISLFVQGTCAQYIEYLYDESGLDLILEKETHNPADEKRIYPACQIYVFWSARYGLNSSWDRRYESYPSCLFGPRSQKA